jgi:hypothetical protein
MNQHYRYVLGMLPFLFVFIAKFGIIQHRLLQFTILLLMMWYCGSSLAVFPHSLSYFNEAVGGPNWGHRYLLGSNLEWGQDVLLLKKWIGKHPECEPIFIAQSSYYDIEIADIKSDITLKNLTTPGWYAIGVNNLYKNKEEYRLFLNYQPVAKIGYSIYIYRIH